MTKFCADWTIKSEMILISIVFKQIYLLSTTYNVTFTGNSILITISVFMALLPSITMPLPFLYGILLNTFI